MKLPDELIKRLKLAINRKHEMFWNKSGGLVMQLTVLLTVNMKCFEILHLDLLESIGLVINRKHEMFWNWVSLTVKSL